MPKKEQKNRWRSKSH